MRAILLSSLCLCLVFLAVGCGPKDSAEERSPGEAAFRSSCQSCHRLPKPTDKTEQEWVQWLDEHRSKAGLDVAETDTILSYLTGSSQP